MYKSLDVLNSGWGVVPNSVVYKYSDPLKGLGQSTEHNLIPYWVGDEVNLTCRIEELEHMAENDNDNRMASELESEGGSGYVLGEGPDAVVISAAEARRLRR